MRPTRIGLAALFIAVLIGAGALAGLQSADAATSAAAALPPVTKEARAAGMKEAPAVVQAAAIPCTVSDARFVGTTKDPKTKAESKFYEVACAEGLGYVVVGKGAGIAPEWTNCLESDNPQADGKPNSLFCVLPGNADTKAMLQPFIAKSGSSCVLDKVRGIGHSATATYFEVSCQSGAGYILKTSAPAKVGEAAQLSTCLAYDAANPLACKLSTPATQLAAVDDLATKAGKSCVVKDRRYILTTTDGSNYFEVACQDGKGYVLQQAVSGALMRTINCADADFVSGGCTLTNSRQAETEQKGLYTSLARKAGYQCDVDKYGPLPANLPGKEVVELSCSNRPDGAIAIFPSSASEQAQVFDCAHSELMGFRCSFSKPDAAYPKLTDDLKKLGKSTCAVSSSRMVGITADKRGYVEVACADGLAGFMVEYSMTPLTAKSVINCSEAKGIAGGCKLPGNTKT